MSPCFTEDKHTNTKTIKQKGIDKNFQQLKTELNLKITIHSLRHNFITKLAENKIQENIIQKIVGHSKDSKVTSKVYTHIRNDAYLKAIDEINKL